MLKKNFLQSNPRPKYEQCSKAEREQLNEDFATSIHLQQQFDIKELLTDSTKSLPTKDPIQKPEKLSQQTITLLQEKHQALLNLDPNLYEIKLKQFRASKRRDSKNYYQYHYQRP